VGIEQVVQPREDVDLGLGERRSQRRGRIVNDIASDSKTRAVLFK
jgi:hypothetical protein